MAEEVKPKSTAAKTKVAEKAEVVEVAAPVEEVAVVEEVKPEPVVEPTPEVTAPEPTPVEEEPVEVMSKRGRKAKADKIAELDHELGIKIHNEPHLEDVYRAEFAEKVAKLK
jgi:hypothetical protein